MESCKEISVNNWLSSTHIYEEPTAFEHNFMKIVSLKFYIKYVNNILNI